MRTHVCSRAARTASARQIRTVGGSSPAPSARTPFDDSIQTNALMRCFQGLLSTRILPSLRAQTNIHALLEVRVDLRTRLDCVRSHADHCRLFTLIMLCDQVSNIISNTTGIEVPACSGSWKRASERMSGWMDGRTNKQINKRTSKKTKASPRISRPGIPACGVFCYAHWLCRLGRREGVMSTILYHSVAKHPEILNPKPEL